MLKVFGDESTDETQSRVFAVAGLIGREIDWQAAEREWMRRTGGKIFHATDCEHERNFELYKDLTQILASSRLAGRGVALDLMALREFFPGIPAEIGYYKCFAMVIIWLVEHAAAKLGELIEFTFDARRESGHNASKLYDLIANKTNWTHNIFMGEKIHFSTRENSRIQMADLVAREAMKALDNQIGPVPRAPRKSMLALCTEGHINLGVLDRKYCADWRAAADCIKDEEPISGASYQTWLNGEKLVDNWSNRFRFMEWLEERGYMSQ